jgi:hypothetical protein
MGAADRVTPQTIKKKIRRKKPTAPKPAYKLPSTFKTEAAADKPKKIKAGPPSPQITGRPSRPQPKRAPIRDRLTREDVKKGKSYVAKQYAAEPGAAKKYFFDRKTGKYTKKSPYGDTVPPDVARRQSYKDQQLKNLSADVARAAPVLKVLDQTTRPLHGIAAGARAAIGGQNVPKAVGRGLANKDKSTFSDVLKDVGAPKAVRSVGGFALDVAADPTTYVSAGAASVARKEAERAAIQTAKEAAKQGLSTKATKKAVSTAARSTFKATEAKGSGAVVKFAGKEVPGVRKATAAAGRGSGKTVRKIVPEKTRNTVRSIASDVNPNITPVGVSKEMHRKAIRITRKARGKVNAGQRDAIDLAHGIHRQIGAKNYAKVVDAIEAEGFTRESPKTLRARAAEIRSLAESLAASASHQRESGKYKFGMANEVHVSKMAQEAEKQAKELERQAARVETHGHPLRISDLPPELSGHARTLQAKMAEIRAVQRKAGVKVPERKGYIPRKLTPQHLEAEGKKAGAPGRSGVNPKSSLARKEKRTMAELRQQEPGRYREDLHALVGERLAEGTESAARADLAKELAGLGTEVKRGTKVQLKPTEGLFRLKRGEELKEINPSSKTFRKRPPKGAKTRYVVLPRKVVERAKEGVNPTPSAKILGNEYGIIHAIDKTTGGFKRLAIGTPGFHLRNFTGDTMQAFTTQGRRVAPNMVRAKRVTKTMAQAQDAARGLGKPKPSGKTLHTKQYGHVPLEQIAENLVKYGAARSGYTARELRELGQSGGLKPVGKVRGKLREGKQAAGQAGLAQRAKRFNLTREDWPRIATAIHALRNGASWEQAAQRVADVHFDYAHLTPFERNIARRIMPFYTWSSRNIPFQAKNIVKNPGRYAAYQKVREEATKTSQADQVDPQTQNMYRQLEKAGVKFPGGLEKYLSAYEQRNAGIPISIGGGKFTVSMGLPLTDLNEAPGAALGSQLEEWYQKGMSLTGPVPKDLIEYMDNHSFFFRDQLERDNSPLVAAPSWAKRLPAPIRKWAHVGPMIDKRTGETVLGWKGKADYVFSVVPGTPQYIKQFTTQGTNQQGKGAVGKALGFVGIKSTPIDPERNATNLAYARMAEIQKDLRELGQRGVNKANPSPRWRTLNDQLKIVTQIAYQGKAAQGYKVLPTQGGPKKIRRSSSRSTSSSGSGFFGGGSSSSSSSSSSGGSGFFDGGTPSKSSGSSSSFF